jgi:NAD(P)-dependent dehydrogenase (short-subunit alcohol dehydrogenase family)
MVGAMRGKAFEGKVALVTGAASGIGKATALAFARAGADVAMCDVDAPRLEETAGEVRALGREALARRVDVAKRDEVAAFAEEVTARFGPLDVLVNNAGVGFAASFLETTLEDWEWMLSINLWGVIHNLHYFVPPMVKRGRGHVVNIASAAGLVGAEPLAAYCTSKFGVVGLSEALRTELAPQGVGVSVICPGMIDTPIVQATRARGRYAEDRFRERTAAIFKKRAYGPEKVARAILDAVLRDRAIVPVTPEAWALWIGKRAFPGLTSAVVARTNKI